LARTLAVVLATAPPAVAQTGIRELMGENFGGLQRILEALIVSNYESVPQHADVIRDHAVKLMKMVPKSAEKERDQFLSYAYLLKSHAEDVGSIATVLAERDRKRALEKQPDLDHLREALAAHYGGMVTACVACHNRYRPQIAP
jgi:hypothetical protein